MEILAFGHYGKAMIAFPSGGGRFHDFEDNGMIAAIGPWLEAGKLKLYCIDSLDNESWLRSDIEPHWRAIRHQAYEDYILKDVLPFIGEDCQTQNPTIGLVGCSLGAYHAANFALKFPQAFPYSLCMSGRYDLEKITASNDTQAIYFNNPLAYLANMHGETLERVKHFAHILLICGQGAFEDKCLEETRRLGELLSIKGIRHETHLWGNDVEHHWYWWRKQLPHYLGQALG